MIHKDNEMCLMKQVEFLYSFYDDENISKELIDDFNLELNTLLQAYETSIDRYHQLLLEQTRHLVNIGD